MMILCVTMVLMDIDPVIKALKYPSIDLYEETDPLLWQYKMSLCKMYLHLKLYFIVFIEERRDC